MKKTGKRKLFTGILIAAMAVGSLFNLSTTVKAEEQNTTITKNSSVRKKITQKNTNFSVQTELGIDGYVAYDISCGFVKYSFYYVEVHPSIPNLLGVFIMKGCWILSNTFLHSLRY